MGDIDMQILGLHVGQLRVRICSLCRVCWPMYLTALPQRLAYFRIII